jgi:hypothetical protein
MHARDSHLDSLRRMIEECASFSNILRVLEIEYTSCGVKSLSTKAVSNMERTTS